MKKLSGEPYRVMSHSTLELESVAQFSFGALVGINKFRFGIGSVVKFRYDEAFDVIGENSMRFTLEPVWSLIGVHSTSLASAMVSLFTNALSFMIDEWLELTPFASKIDSSCFRLLTSIPAIEKENEISD